MVVAGDSNSSAYEVQRNQLRLKSINGFSFITKKFLHLKVTIPVTVLQWKNIKKCRSK
jgi:hypothetical protein